MNPSQSVIFPGQGSQFPGMARELFDQHLDARALLTRANDILGFSLTDIMFGGTDEDLRRTDVTQPAIFVHSVAQFVARPIFSRPARRGIL